jgi:hypothetical protein
MSDKLIIKAGTPYDGEYELDAAEAFTTTEWRWIKKISGYMPATITDGLKGADPDVFVALSVVAMSRAGRITREEVLPVAEQLAEVPFDGATITLQGEASEGPPAVSQETSVDAESKSGSSGSSGDDSPTPSESQENGQSPTGPPLSDTSATSELATSGT